MLAPHFRQVLTPVLTPVLTEGLGAVGRSPGPGVIPPVPCGTMACWHSLRLGLLTPLSTSHC